MASTSSNSSTYYLPFSYDGNNVDKKVHEIVQLVNENPLSEEVRIADVYAFKAMYPVFDCNNEGAFVVNAFSDLKAISRKLHYDFNQLVGEELQQLLIVANYFFTIRSVTYIDTRKVYFGVLAMLLQRNLSTGGGSSPFVLRCAVLYEVIAKKKDLNAAVDKHFLNRKRNKKRRIDSSSTLNGAPSVIVNEQAAMGTGAVGTSETTLEEPEIDFNDIGEYESEEDGDI